MITFGAPEPDLPNLRPRRIGEIIDVAIKIWSKNFRQLVPLTAMFMLPIQALSAFAMVATKPTITDTLEEWQKNLIENPGVAPSAPKFTNQQIGAVVVSQLIAFVGTMIITAALTAFVADRYLGRETTTKEALRVAVRRGPLMMLYSFLTIVLAVLFGGLLSLGAALLFSVQPVLGVVGFVVAFVGFVWLLNAATVAGPAIIVERIGPIKAVRRSFQIVRGLWWRTLGCRLVGWIVTAIPIIMISGILTGFLSFAGGNNESFRWVWSAIAGTVGASIVAPISAAIAVLIYVDLRIRKEGFDLEMLASSIAPGDTNSDNPQGPTPIG